jgi:hypothetical protein
MLTYWSLKDHLMRINEILDANNALLAMYGIGLDYYKTIFTNAINIADKINFIQSQNMLQMAHLVFNQAKKDANFFLNQEWDTPDPDVDPIVDLAHKVIHRLQSLP